jgi:hypothetical protein
VIERAIENWLIETNERNYQSAFCQVLMHEGHRVLFSSSHGPMEQGKDIITIGPDGRCHAYQTKTGDIGLAEWRSIAGEIQELIELPVDYPGIDKAQIHRAYLVTNGSITDPVRLQVTDRNEDNERKSRQYAQLEVIGRDSLLKSFIDAQGRFVPRQLPDMRAFLELYLDDGCSNLSTEKLFSVLEGAAFGDDPVRKSDAVDAITSSLITVSYLLNAFERAGNYAAMAEGWAVLASCIARYVARHAIDGKHWRVSLDLVLTEISANLALLRKDAVSRNDFLEGDIRVDGGLVLGARTTIVLGLLAFHEIWRFGNRPKDTAPDEVLSLIRQHSARRFVWGDSAFPYIFFIIKFLEREGESALAQDLLTELFASVIDSNLAPPGAPLFPGPYVGIEEILGTTIPDHVQDLDFEGYRGGSYILRVMLEMLVRRGRHDVVSAYWRRFSYCQQHEFVPDRAEDVFAWRTQTGTNASGFPKQTQSWSELVAESSDRSSIPAVYRDFHSVLGLQMLICPQRATPTVVRELDVEGP